MVVLIFGFFLALAYVAMRSLWAHPGTVGATLPHDYYHVHWGYWWIRHALASGIPVYTTNYVHFPFTTNLAFHTLAPFWYPLWALLEPIAGTITAVNVIMTLALALAGFLMWLLMRWEGVVNGLALGGGVIFLLTPANLLSAMLSNTNYMGVFWLPALLLLWKLVSGHDGYAAGNTTASLAGEQLRRAAGRGLLWSLVFGAALYGMMMTDYQWALFSAFLIVPYAAYTLWRTVGWGSRLRLIALGGLALVLAVGLLWFAGPLPFILSYDRASFAPQPIEKAAGIPFPLGYVTRLDPYQRTLSLGYVAIPLVAAAALLGLVTLRGRVGHAWLWLLLCLTPLVLAAGPAAAAYVWLHQVLGGVFRVPARFAPVFLLPALLFAGLVLSQFRIVKKHSRLVTGLALTVSIIDGTPWQAMPIRPAAQAYNFYSTMRFEQGTAYRDYAIVEVPIAGGSGEAWVGDFQSMETQFYGTIHQQRMLNGTFARAPLNHFWYWLYDDPMLAWLGQRRYLESEVVTAQLEQRLREWPIGYLIIHQDLIGRDGPTNQEIIGFLNQLPDLLCPVWIERDAVVYRATWHPDGCPGRTPPEIAAGVYEIDIGSPGDERYLGWGWHPQEDVGATRWRWVGAYEQADIYVDLPPGDYVLTIATQSYWEERTLTIYLDDSVLADSTASVSPASLREYSFHVTHASIGEGRHIKVTLGYDATISPRAIGQSEDNRTLALAVDWVRFTRR
jgi:hypothetical protein